MGSLGDKIRKWIALESVDGSSVEQILTACLLTLGMVLRLTNERITLFFFTTTGEILNLLLPAICMRRKVPEEIRCTLYAKKT